MAILGLFVMIYVRIQRFTNFTINHSVKFCKHKGSAMPNVFVTYNELIYTLYIYTFNFQQNSINPLNGITPA